MFYCFLYDDLEEFENDPLMIQMEYARCIDRLYIGNLKQQRIYNGCDPNRPIELKGKKILLRSTCDNMMQGIRLLKRFGADLLENEDDITKIENWYKWEFTDRPMFRIALSAIERGIPDDDLQKCLAQWDNIFLKSIEKGFSAVIKTSRIIQRDPQILTFLKERSSKHGKEFIVTKYMEIRMDSIGRRESRHIVMNSQVINSSRMVHSIRHTVSKSHLSKLQDITSRIKNMKDFPQNYVLDLGEFKEDSGEIHIDIVELNPLTCSMCYVNNSVFTHEVSQIKETRERFLMGYEYCYDALKNPEKYHQVRSSNRNYAYVDDERYYFL